MNDDVPEPPFWRYLPGRYARVRHALSRSSDATALCGAYAVPASEWRGTGTQLEYETVAQLPECKACLAHLGRRPAHWRGSTRTASDPTGGTMQHA